MMRWCWSCALLDVGMNRRVSSLARQYTTTLQGYLVVQQETVLQQAYQLGREAIARGLGVLQMVRIHQQALASCLSPLPPVERTRALGAAETFFLETLSPFEAAHRGFHEANQRLRQLNDTLEHRNAELAALNRNLCDLSSQILHVQEEERKRISRELHDEAGAKLTAINMNLSVLQRGGNVDAARLKKTIADTQNLLQLQQTMETLHRFASELRPAMLDELGLLPALRSYLKGLAERTGLRVNIRASAEAENLNNDQKTVLFRVAQESLTNVAKHAQASQVGLTLRKITHGFQMEIKDDGKSFQVDRLPSANGKKRLGLLGMRERVRLVNGRFAVESAPGKGTTVRVVIPLKGGSRRHGVENADF